MEYYIVDAFADELFKGNQAGVCIMDKWPDDCLMQNIAAENNLAETAFVVKNSGHYDLRWFTPAAEIDLCGHATLAAAYIISNFTDKGVTDMEFHTKSGVLPVKRKDDLFEMDFPSRMPEPVEITETMEKAVGLKILESHKSRDFLLLVENEQAVLNAAPRFDLISVLPDHVGIIVTAKGESADFVSRFFAPNVGVPEDPVTGSAHATLIPFWAERLNKGAMVAKQLSKRGGTLYCESKGERVKISGKAVLYLKGEIVISHTA